jgi:dihydroflavonol-4-reductase
MIVVTGGAGLVGRELINQLLAKGEAVTAIYNKTPLTGFNSPLLTVVQCDILDVVGLEAILQGAEKIYHCAALVNFIPSRKQELYKVNVEGTANVVNAALNANVQKMLHVSSVAALGRIRENEVINESMQWTPETSNSNYGQSKYLGELEVWRGAAEGLQAVVVNPSIILGPGNWNSGSAQLFKSVYDGFPWYSEGVAGFVDVRDVAGAMIALMDSSISGQRFILSGHNTTYKKVFELIAKEFNKKAPHKKVTPLLAAIVWRLEKVKSIFTGKEPLVTKETALTALTKVYYDNSKLKKYLPAFEYRRIEDTIQFTCNELLKQAVV